MSIQGSGPLSFQKVVVTDVCVSTVPSNFLTVFSCFVSALPTQQDGIPCMGGILAMYSRIRGSLFKWYYRIHCLLAASNFMVRLC